MPYWAVAMTKPNCEKLAQVNLERQGLLTYLPVFLTKVGKVIRVKTLFPRYIFVQIEDQWHSINSTFGVSRLILTNENKPAVLPDKIIEELKAREDGKGHIALTPLPKFNPGENVRLAQGAFEGYTGIYEGMSGPERSKILIELLGRKVSIVVDETHLAAVAIRT